LPRRCIQRLRTVNNWRPHSEVVGIGDMYLAAIIPDVFSLNVHDPF